jgi:4-diphosphocytidyl-2C-methyl-D-erythritol kinase
MGGPKSSNGNDLEPAALELYPELEKWKRAIEDHTGKRARLAGSGSTWFVEGDFPRKLLDLENQTNFIYRVASARASFLTSCDVSSSAFAFYAF